MSYQDYINSQNQHLKEDILGRGAGDPDVFGYPGEYDPKPITIKSHSRAYKIRVRVV